MTEEPPSNPSTAPTSDGPPKGRLPTDDRHRLLGRVLEFISRQHEERGQIVLTVSELQQEFAIGKKLASSIVKELGLVSRITSGPNTIWSEEAAQTFFEDQLRVQTAWKKAISVTAAELLEAGTSVACSAGTTVAYCVNALRKARRYTRLLTNSLANITDGIPARNEPAELENTGGVYHREINAFTGDRPIEAFAKERCQSALIGVSGLDESGALYVRFREELRVLSTITRSVTERILIVSDIGKLCRLKKQDEWAFATLGQLLADAGRPGLEICLITNPPSVLPAADGRKVARVLEGLEELSRRDSRFSIVFAEPARKKT